MSVVRVGSREFAQFTLAYLFRHERELRTFDHGGCTPNAHALSDCKFVKRPPLVVSVRHGFFAPYVFLSRKRPPVQLPVHLHVGQVHKQFKGYPRQHLVDVRVVIRHVKFPRSPFGAFRLDVAQTHDFGILAPRQMRKIHARHAAATDYSHSDFSWRRCGCVSSGTRSGRKRDDGGTKGSQSRNELFSVHIYVSFTELKSDAKFGMWRMP